MDKKVLLIFPKTGLDIAKVSTQMPMGLLCVAATLVEKGFKVSILDQRVERNFFSKLKFHLDARPLCAGITTMTGSQILYALKISEFVRRHSSIPVVWGGIHPTLMAHQTLQDENVDIVVRGEGEVTFAEVLDVLSSHGSLAGIKGVSWKDAKTIRHNPERELLDLNRLAPIPYDLIDAQNYILSQIPGRNRSLEVYTSRGCPGSCTFCYNQSFNRSLYRVKDIDLVIREIEWLVKRYNLDSIYINDDNFFADAERVHRFCRALIDTRIVPAWACQGSRIDSLERIDLSLVEKSGCRHFYIGIESGSEKILKYIQKNITVAQIKRIIGKLSKTKMIPHYNFMVGYPQENTEELFETIELVNYIMKTDPKAYISSFHLITPYPGTKFYELLKRDGVKFPSTLKGWADIRWEFHNAPWVSREVRKIAHNLTLLTYFIDTKILDRIQGNNLLALPVRFLMFLARLRWRHKKFWLCPEFRLVNRLANYRISRETK